VGNENDKVKYLPHAHKRMRQRLISEAEVEYCLNNHHISYTDREGNPIYVAETPEGRRIKVVVRKENQAIVITVGD